MGGRSAQQRGRVGYVVRHAGRRRYLPRGHRRVEECLHHRHRRLSVERRMMNLAVETDATGRVQSVDDMELPQWAASVHRRCMQPRDACLKRGEVPGGRQPNASHVVLEIDIIGLDPGGVAQAQRGGHESPREHGRQVQSPGQMVSQMCGEVALEPRWQAIHVHRAHVHRHRPGFQMQEESVESAQCGDHLRVPPLRACRSPRHAARAEPIACQPPTPRHNMYAARAYNSTANTRRNVPVGNACAARTPNCAVNMLVAEITSSAGRCR